MWNDFLAPYPEMERPIRAVKMHYRRDPRAEKLDQLCDSAMDAVSSIKNGGITNPMATLACLRAYWLLFPGGKCDKRLVTPIKNSSTAIVFAIGHWPISLF